MNYLPANEEQLLDWLKNFSSHLPTIGIQLGITPAEAASLNGLIFSVKNDIRNGNGKLEEKELKKNNMLAYVEILVDRMRKNSSYNENEHGRKLGIVQ